MTCCRGDNTQAFLLQSVPKPFTIPPLAHSANFLTGVGRDGVQTVFLTHWSASDPMDHLAYWHSWMGPEQSLSEQETCTSWSYKNNPWAILCGVNAGKNPLWFSLFRLFLYLYLTWGGVVGEGRKLLQCCNNIYTLILGNNYVTDPESHYHRKVKRKKKAILIYLVEEL